MFRWDTARGWGTGPALLPHCEPGLVEGADGAPDPVGTAAGVRLPGEAGLGGLALRESRAGGGPRGEMLREEAWPGAPQGVKGVGEVGQRCEERQGGERWHGGGMQG